MSDTPTAILVDCSTGKVEERPLTADQIAAHEAAVAAYAVAEAERVAAEEAKAAAKASAIAKLTALGLTEEEAAAFAGS